MTQWNVWFRGSAGSSCYRPSSPGKWRQAHGALVWRQGNIPRHFNTSTEAGSLFFKGWVVLTSVPWAASLPSWRPPAQPGMGLPPLAQRMHCLWWGSALPRPGLLWRTPAKLSGRNILTQPLLCKLFFEQKFTVNSLRLSGQRACSSASLWPRFKIAATQSNTCNYTVGMYAVASSLKPKNCTCQTLLMHSPTWTHVLRTSVFSTTWHYPSIITAL